MRAQESPRSVEGALAAAHHRVVSRRQLLDAGLNRGVIGRHLADGRLVGLYPGVYAAGHAHLTHEGRWLAAVLSAGEGAALSHRSAAALWGLTREWLDFLEASSARSRHRIEGVILHRPRSLPLEDVTSVRGIPVTTVARTLVDVADVVQARTLARLLETAEQLRLDATPVPIPGRRGAKRLETALAGLRVRVPHMTRSELERRMVEICDTAGLPTPDANFFVDGQEVDFTWTAQRVAVEVDGWETHGTRAAFGRDRRRSTELTLAGWTVVRFTYDDIVHEPGYVARALSELLAARAM